MNIGTLSEIFNSTQRVKALSAVINNNKSRNACINGVTGSSAAMVFSGLPRLKSPYMVIANDIDDAGYMYNDLVQLTGEKHVLMFPSGYKRDIKYGQSDPASEILRAEVLSRWYSDADICWVITYPEALAEKVIPNAQLSQHTLSISKDELYDMQEVVKELRALGFSEQDYVYEPGQFAVRGSILDVFSYSNELPYRIDFFGDEIESIRRFSVETQLSQSQTDKITIVSHVSNTQSEGVSLLEFVGNDTVLLCHDSTWLIQRIRAIAEESISQQVIITDDGDKDALKKVINPGNFVGRYTDMKRIEYGVSCSGEHDSVITYHCTPQGVYHKNFDLISESLNSFISKGYTVYILSDNDKQIDRLRVIFEDRGDNINFTPVERTLHEGFVDNDAKICVFTDHQIFDRFHKYNLKSDKARSGKLALSLKELNQIEVGDYIVHVDHGVGRFSGLVRTNVNGKMQELIKLTYLNDDIIFVSIHALHKLAKYRGKEGEPPRVNKLGSGAWNKLKERTKAKMKDIARDLIKLYAAHKYEKGFAFSPDSYLQQELEASFIYEDTPDQMTATAAVKQDMENIRPMDRLICGDVGFGKTEIAIRAAFKAATDNKQTAVLVPTTVLAFQHYQTFKERLANFPVTVEYISRARTAKQVKQIVADLAEGKIDILIGTHKLIGKAIKFKDLGLLIVDEEQKFGVTVKEKLRQLKTNVDTLTMSATPIPRTLQFSLMGARDLSSINTPPANRYPIITSVNAFDETVIQEAINFEMSRNGQVFFVNNRIEQLYELENTIRRLVPDARVIVAHGQMPPEKLERSILDYVNHDYDILLSTTIIESGIDMPNTNTIIINNAQNFGLSELHQLRGRVGRSNRKAFCYLLVPAHLTLTAVARRRLQAIESFSELGSGIHIAMQDLDIRGAGNLLGAEQSGFIADLGYETYEKILKEAITELRTEEFSDVYADEANDEGTDYVNDCVIDSDLDILLPMTYVPQDRERISLYQELDNMERETDVLEFRKHLEDRFGKIPPEAQELIRVVSLRRLARKLGIEKVALKQGMMYLYFVGDDNKAYYQSPEFGKLLQYLQTNPRTCQLRQVKEKRSMVVKNVPTVECAVNILQSIRALESL